MKEFIAQTGGRYTYADDLENLQELALAFSHIFDDCDNFVISGCEVGADSIGPGYVYINGKIRQFSGATNIVEWPVYLIESNTVESVPYEGGIAKVGRNIYGVTVGSVRPAIQDPLTHKTPAVIEVQSTGVLTLKEAFMGKYSLLLDSQVAQSVDSPVTLLQTLSVNNKATFNNDVTLQNGAYKVVASLQDGTLEVKVNNKFGFKIGDETGFQFSISGSPIISIVADKITFNQPVNAPQGTFGGLVLSDSDIYQGAANDNAALYINYKSYSGEDTHYRDTIIGNGRNQPLLALSGVEETVTSYVPITIASGENMLILKNVNHGIKDHNNFIRWYDASDTLFASIGTEGPFGQVFRIQSNDGQIQITAKRHVNITPLIKEDGVALSDKYADKATVNSALAQKANASNVWSRTASDLRYGQIGLGLSQFVSNSATKEQCRSQIGAIGESDLNICAKLSNRLADMATTEAAKKQIRDNIGAVSREDVTVITQDTLWCNISGQNLKARQIGNIVCIQGTVTTRQNGTLLFRVPANIAPPTYAVCATVYPKSSCVMSCKIDANSKDCMVTYSSSSSSVSTSFSLTYMV